MVKANFHSISKISSSRIADAWSMQLRVGGPISSFRVTYKQLSIQLKVTEPISPVFQGLDFTVRVDSHQRDRSSKHHSLRTHGIYIHVNFGWADSNTDHLEI